MMLLSVTKADALKLAEVKSNTSHNRHNNVCDMAVCRLMAMCHTWRCAACRALCALSIDTPAAVARSAVSGVLPCSVCHCFLSLSSLVAS